MQNKFPPVWLADIRNNGKMVALFDKAQQDRNLNSKYSNGRKEVMYI